MILSNVTDKIKYNIASSKSFRERIKNIKLRPNDVLVSYDVKSLFTNIPLERTILAAMARWEQIKEHTKMPKD
jgi:hypothetical protein